MADWANGVAIPGAASFTPPDLGLDKKIPALVDALWSGLDQAYKTRNRDLFKNGVPTSADGSVDFATAAKRALEAGGSPGIDKFVELANTDLARKRLEYGNRMGRVVSPLPGDESAPAPSYGLGGTSAQPPTPVVSPSLSRNVVATAPALGQRGGAAPTSATPGTTPPGGDNGTTSVASLITLRMPGELAGPAINGVAATLNVDPNQPLNMADPAVRQRFVEAYRKYSGDGTASDATPAPATVPYPRPNPFAGGGDSTAAPAAASAQPQLSSPQAAPSPTFSDRFSAATPDRSGTGIQQPGDPTLGGLIPPGRSVPFQLSLLTRAINSGMLSPEVAKSYQARIDAIRAAIEPTPAQKEWRADARPGESLSAYEARRAGDKAFTEKQADRYGKRYDAVTELGDRAATEIPQLEMIQKQMNTDPNFYSGFGSKYSMLWKQMVSGAAHAFPSLGLDPNAAFSQEAFGKVVSGNILNSLGQLKGLGQIRVAEINLAKEAAASQNYSAPANQVLVEIAKRLHQRSIVVADMAHNYNGGRLDAGFDKQVANYDKANPIFSDAEINNFRNIISSGGGRPRVKSMDDVAGLQPGTEFVDPYGKVRRVPMR